MNLDPAAKAFLDQRAAQGAPELWELGVEGARQLSDSRAALFGEMELTEGIEDLSIPGPVDPIRVRLYRSNQPSPQPVLVFFHGGGWVVGSINGHDGTCRALASRAGCTVMSVDYRRAPENKFPAAVEDAWAAVCWVAQHGIDIGIDGDRLAVGGDGSGGNLAAVVARWARDRDGPTISLQVLIYPVTDYDFETPSYLANAKGYNLSRATMMWYWSQYLPDPSLGPNPDASPLRAETLAGLPPALVITCEFDPLRDQGEAYAKRLKEAGVKVTQTRYEGQIHGFFRIPKIIPQANQAIDQVAAALSDIFHA